MTTLTAARLSRLAYEADRDGRPDASTLAHQAADAYAQTQGYRSAAALYAAQHLTCLGRTDR